MKQIITLVIIAAATLFIDEVFAQAPVISYTNPPAYNINVPVTPLAPVNTGGAVPATVYALTSYYTGQGGVVTPATYIVPGPLTTDNSGNLYVAATNLNTIVKITPAGAMTTFAGDGVIEHKDGTGTQAGFFVISALTADAAGNIYVTEGSSDAASIRKITPAGVVTTLYTSDRTLEDPRGIAIDASGNLYVTDITSNKIFKITQAGRISVFAGSIPGEDNGQGTAATFTKPYSIVIDKSGNFYVTEMYSNWIRKITPAAVVSTFAGKSNVAGSANGNLSAAGFNLPRGLTIDAGGNLYVGDSGNYLIRKIGINGVVSTLAGNGQDSGIFYPINGIGEGSTFNSMDYVAVDAAGSLFVADLFGLGLTSVRKVVTTGYKIIPAMPAGLTFDSKTGTISGVPTAPAPGALFTITGTNTIGSDTTTVTLSVADQIPSVTYGIADFDPKPGMSGVTYTSSNPAVATVVNNKIHVVGAGLTTITGKVSAGSKSQQLIVKKAVLTVTADNQSAYYSYDSPPLTFSYSGFVNGDGTSSLSVLPVISTTRTNPSGTGTYPITLSGGVANNYTFNYVAGVFTVKTVKFVTYGNPDFDPQPSLKGITYTTSNPAVATVVNNKIHTTGFGAVLITGTLGGHSQTVPITVERAMMTIDAVDVKKKYGTVNPPLKLAFTGLLNGDVPSTIVSSQSPTTTATTSSAPGAYPVTAQFTYNGDPPYYVSKYDGTLNILPLAPVIKYNSPQTFIKGDTVKALSPANTGGAISGTYMQTSNFGIGTLNNPAGITTDGAGNVYVVQKGTNSISVLYHQTGGTAYYAGDWINGPGYADGMFGRFNNPGALAIDAAGNLYVGDYGNKMVRRVMKNNFVNTLADNIYAAGLAADANGNVFVADNVAMVIYKITPASPGFVKSIFAGSGTAGFANGTGTQASFNNPGSMSIDDAGNLYVLDNNNSAIRKITPAGVVSTFVSGIKGTGITIDNTGNFYVCDGNLIKMVTPAGTVTKVAGSDTSGTINGIGTASRFNAINSINADVSGNLYVSDSGNKLVRKLSIIGYGIAPALPLGLKLDDSTGVISGIPLSVTPATNYTITGYNSGGSSSYTVKIGVTPVNRVPVINYPTPQVYTRGIPADTISPINSGGYVDKGFTITPALPAGLKLDTVTGRIAGTPTGVLPVTNYTVTAHNTAGNGSTVITIAVSPVMLSPNLSYSGSKVYIKNTTISPLYSINKGGAVPAVNYGQVKSMYTIASKNIYDPDYYIISGGSLAMDASGNIYVGSNLNVIQKITPAGVVTTIAGKYDVSGSANGPDTAARFNEPKGIAVDGAGNIYVADYSNNRIRKITPAGVVSTFAGSGTPGAANGTGTAASFSRPNGVAFDSSGNLYVTDQGNNLIRKITPAGEVSTFAGSGTPGTANGTGAAASFTYLTAITIDSKGNLYVCDISNIRKITPAAVVTTINITVSGNGLAVDLSGNIYVTANSYIWKITPNNTLTTLAGSPAGQYEDPLIDGIGIAAHFATPQGIVINAEGNLFVSDYGGRTIRKVIATGYILNTPLPAGLNFNTKTGFISGMPTTLSPAANYSITGINAAGSSTAIISITVQDSAGNTQLALKKFDDQIKTTNKVTVYPNPFVEALNINMNNDKTDNVKVTITHFNGRSVFTKNYTNSGVINVDMTGYEKGIYILNLTQAGKQFAYKIIKN